MNFDVGLLLSSIATLSGLIQTVILINDHNNKKAKERLKYAEDKMKLPLKTGTKALEKILSEEEIVSLFNEITQINSTIYSNIKTSHASEEDISTGKTAMCEALEIIKQNNNDELPTERLKKMWMEYHCEDVARD